jgi:hypothetical protein
MTATTSHEMADTDLSTDSGDDAPSSEELSSVVSLTMATAIEMTRLVASSAREGEIAAIVCNQLVSVWKIKPADASKFIATLFEMVNRGEAF